MGSHLHIEWTQNWAKVKCICGTITKGVCGQKQKCLNYLFSDLFCRNRLWCITMRKCLNELQKEYCEKLKLIALDWKWVTLISCFQMNRLGHSYWVMHKVEGKTHYIFEKLNITSQKSTLFLHFLWSNFRSPVLTSEFLLIKISIHMSDFVLILSLLYYWPFCGSAFVLGCVSAKAKNYSVKLVS